MAKIHKNHQILGIFAKVPKIPIETLGNTWYFRHGRKSWTFYKKSMFPWNFQYFSHFSDILTFLVKTQKSHFSGSCRFGIIGKFTENRKYSWKSYFFGNFTFSAWNATFSHEKSTFRQCLKYQVLPSVSIGFGCHFHENQYFQANSTF